MPNSRSKSSLETLYERIVEDFKALQEAGIGISGVGMNSKEGIININLLREDQGWIEELRRRYGTEPLRFIINPRLPHIL